MAGWIQFGRGPLFRFAFSLMLLGLLRILLNTILGIAEAYGRSPDRIVPWKTVIWQTLAWLVPIGRLWNKRPAFSSLSMLFHAGLLTVPFFLAAHVLLWRGATGFAWQAMPPVLADWLTLLVIITGTLLLGIRLADRSARALSRGQDYLWLLLLSAPFVTGYVCSHTALGPKAYQELMLVHVYSGDLILLLIPFTKIAHCVLAPLSQVVTAVAWKFVPGAGDRVAATLGYADRPSWTEKARAGEGARVTGDVIVK